MLPRPARFGIDSIGHRTVELAQMAALGLLVSAAPVGAANAQCGKCKQPHAQAEPGPMQTKLNEMAAMAAERTDQAKLDARQQALDEIRDTGILDHALTAGQTAPDFQLPDATGETVQLSDLLEAGPVVLTFYRGGWCPFCNIQLHAYQEHLDDFKELDAQLVAISPQTPDNSISTKEKLDLDFTVLSDPGNTVADAFGIRYTVPDSLGEGFAEYIAEINGDDSKTLPLAATYVIDTDGVIRYAFVEVDYKLRAEPGDIVDSLKAMKAGDSACRMQGSRGKGKACQGGSSCAMMQNKNNKGACAQNGSCEGDGACAAKDSDQKGCSKNCSGDACGKG
ncbi:MAG TPA: AhpC/TSA family protein [Phycisphaerales bacterium]|nr:AhpC/TSA family protein [Phycisphaerales bacterium]